MADEQILAQSTLERNPVPSGTAGGLSPEQQRAANIRTEMGGNDTLAGFNAALNVTRGVDVGVRTKTTDQNFGIERDAATGAKKRTEPDSKDRFDRSTKALTQVEELLDSGIVTDRAGAIAKLESVMSVLPGYDTYLASLSPADRALIIDGLMKDPKFIEKARMGYERATAEGSRLTDQVTEAKKKFDEAETARAAKEAERSAAGLQLTAAQTAESEFSTKLGASGKTKEQELLELQEDSTGNPRDLEAEVRDTTITRTRAQTTFDALNSRFAQVQTAGLVKGDADYDKAEGALNNAQIALKNAEGSLAAARKERQKRIELEREKRENPEKVARLDADVIRLSTEEGAALTAKLLAQADLNSKQIDRAAAEEAFATAAERVLPDALREHLREQMQAANEANRRLLDKQATGAQTQTEAQINTMIKTRYLTEKKGKKGSSEMIIDDGQARLDVNFLLAQRGDPSLIVKSALTAMYPPDATTGAPNPKVAEFMAKPDFVSKYGAEIAKNALIQYVQGGGKLSEAQQLYIDAQPWGQNMAEQIFTSPKLVAKEKEMIANGQLPAGGFKEAMLDKKGRGALGWLLLIAAGAIPFYGIYKAATVPLSNP